MNKELIEKMKAACQSEVYAKSSVFETCAAVAHEHYNGWVDVNDLNEIIQRAYNDGVKTRDTAHHNCDVLDNKIEADKYAYEQFDINDYLPEPPKNI